MQTRLAYKNLTHDPRRLVIACVGIGFAVLLMFVQLGFQDALFSSQVQVLGTLKGEVFIISRARFALAAEKRFPLDMLGQAKGCEGVANAYPIYAEWMTSVLRNTHPRAADSEKKGYRIRTIGFHLGDPVFKSPEIAGQQARLRQPRSALFDSRSKTPNFSFPTSNDTVLAAAPAELAGKKVRLVGSFDLGADFVHDGNLVMSAQNFADYFPFRKRFGDPLSLVDIGVVQVAPGHDPETVRARVHKRLGESVLVFTRAGLRSKEKNFWANSTPIGLVFAAGTGIGFFVGVVICYQIIFSGISDHMPEYATLKAMGYGADYFTRLIVAEGVWLAILGFIPGLLVSWLLYWGLGAWTGLPLEMKSDIWGWVLAYTVAMCVVSGLLAVRKLLVADPASLF